MKKINYWKVTTKDMEFTTSKKFDSVEDAKKFAETLWEEHKLRMSRTRKLVTETEYTSLASTITQQKVYRNIRTNLFDIAEIIIQKKLITIN